MGPHDSKIRKVVKALKSRGVFHLPGGLNDSNNAGAFGEPGPSNELYDQGSVIIFLPGREHLWPVFPTLLSLLSIS